MSQSARLQWVLVLNLALVAGMVVAGLMAGSLGVLAAAGDSAADASGIALGLIAIHFRDTHGKVNAPTYIAAVNATLLLIVAITVAVEAIQRLATSGAHVEGVPTLLASVVAVIVMLISAAILGRSAATEDLHMRSVLLDTLADALAAAGVAITGAIISITGRFFWLDSVVAIIISAVIAIGAARLLVEAANALRHGTPLELSEDD
jgi:cobalt-zinc-cadmium efflux system protein